MQIPLFALCLLGVASAQLNLTNGDLLINFVNSRQSTWQAHHNFKREVLPYYATKLVGKDSPKVSHSFNGFNVQASVITASNDTVPESFDARDQWPKCPGIGQVRDQGPCSSSWAIAPVTTLSDRFCTASNGTITIDLSPQDLLECCGTCGDCKSGSPKIAWYHLALNGIVTGGDYQLKEGCKPYEIAPCEHSIFTSDLKPCSSMNAPKVKKCRKKCTVKNYEGKYATDIHFVKIVQPMNNASKMQEDIMANGPLQASLNIYEDMLYYKTGVYTHLVGSKLGSQAVKIIGWGEEGDAKTPYWLVVNSWNTNWGEKGLFKILRGNNECGIETNVYSATPDLSI